jgi:DUF4097 and DUF4098 domain-containing protein YvlB
MVRSISRLYTLSIAFSLSVILAGCVTNVVDLTQETTSTQDATQFTSLAIPDQGSNDITISGNVSDTLQATAQLSIWANDDSKARSIADQLQFDWTNNAGAASLAVHYGSSEQELAKLQWLRIVAPQRLHSKIETSSGDISVNNMHGDLDLESSSGDIVGSTTGWGKITSTSGDVTASLGDGGEITTTSGNVKATITNNEFESLTIDASSGDVDVAIADGAGITFDITSESGDIALQYSGTDLETNDHLSINVNGGGKHVTISSSSGDVKIHTLR